MYMTSSPDPVRFQMPEQPALLLARYVEHRREELGMSVEFAARLTGIADSEWCALEAGFVPEQWADLRAIAEVLEVPSDRISFFAAISLENQQK